MLVALLLWASNSPLGVLRPVAVIALLVISLIVVLITGDPSGSPRKR